MKPLPLVLSTSTVVITAAVLLAVNASGAEADAPNAILAPPAAHATGESSDAGRPRAISPATAARLAAVAPPYAPPTATRRPGSSASAVAETEDKPRNGILRLPRYIVRQPKEKLPTLNELQVLTPKGKVDLAMKAFPGLRVGSFWIFRNDAVALEMLNDELMAERKQRMMDLVSLLPANAPNGSPDNPVGDSKQRRLIQDALSPRSSWTTMAPDHESGK